ncbi:MAG: hypothetical protein L6Q81_05655 [Bacteroidia bacterium]|nr:hypothetical protein [Bacteroidia bacterium]
MRPGKHPHSIIETAVLGYDYGSERGQIKEITDHNQILPLYDFGIGTYDFDMSAVQPSIKLAQAMAENDTIKFFES